MATLSNLFATPVPTNAAVPISDGSGAAGASLDDWVTSGGSGGVNPGTANQVGYYPATGSNISGDTTWNLTAGILNTLDSQAVTNGIGKLKIFANTTSDGYIYIREASADNFSGGINAVKARGTVTSPGATQSGDDIFAFTCGGFTGSGWNEFQAAMVFRANETWTPSANGTRFDFALTPDGSTTRANFFRFLAGGVIESFGNTSLTIQSPQTSAGGAGLNVNSAAASAYPAIIIQVSGTNKAHIAVARVSNDSIGGSAADDLCLRSIASKSILFSTDNGTTVALKISASTGEIIAISSIKTGAPASGTAAAWKLGSLQTNYAEADIAGVAVRLALSNRGLLPLFDHFADAANVTTTETDLYSDTIAAAQLGANGDKLEFEYGGVFVSSGTATRQVKLYFGGTAIFDTGTLTLSLSSAWSAFATIIRVSSTVVRYMVSFTTQGAALSAYTSAGELTGLTLSGTNVAKITGQAAGIGASSGDITAKLGSIVFVPAA